MSKELKYLLTGVLLGSLVSAFVWHAQSAVGQVDWELILSFPVFLGIGGRVLAYLLDNNFLEW